MRASVIAVLALLAAVGAALWWWPVAPDKRSDGERARLAELEALDAATIDDAADAAALVERFAFTRLESVEGGATLDEGDLPAAAKTALRRTLASLLNAYADNRPEAVHDAMRAAGESLGESGVAAIDQALAEAGVETPADASPRDRFVAVWNELGCDSQWAAVLPDSGKIVVWRCGSADAFRDTKPHTGDKDVFRNVTNYHHLFEGRPTLEQEARRAGRLIVADARWSVEHTEARQGERAMYFARLWWEGPSKRWRPAELRFVATGADRRAESPKLLF